jgi:hypothetical protein
MGKELCKPCDNYLKGEEKNLSKSQQKKIKMKLMVFPKALGF